MTRQLTRIARVFPRRTNATPTDALAFTDAPGLFPPEVDEVHISVAFTWDMPEAERLAREWSVLGVPVLIGGPGTGQAGGDFTPGLYLKPGYVITSRGCHNRCWFCSVWKREGDLHELPITEGWNVLDDNLLACSEEHIRAVFAMLKRQPQKAEFTGGLEAKLLKPWHVELLKELKPLRLFFAYDTPDDLEPLIEAGKLLDNGPLRRGSHEQRCYVLVGHPKDTFDAAEQRLGETWRAGFFPMAMLWRDDHGRYNLEWRRFQRVWNRAAIVCTKLKELAEVTQ